MTEEERVENFLKELKSISKKYDVYIDQFYDDILILNGKHDKIDEFILKSKIRKLIEEELPDDDIMETCDLYDVNGVEIRRKLEQLLESEGE